MTAPMEGYTHAEIAGLADASPEQLALLDRSFTDLVALIGGVMVRREGIPEQIRQSHPGQYEVELMIALALDPTTLARAEATARLTHDTSTHYFVTNQ